MTASDNESAAGLDYRRLLLLLLFAGSGCSALIYEIVWYQLLQLSIGSTAVSLGILLATFMGGLCIGSLALPRLLPRAKLHPLRVYAAIEIGIGVLGLLELAVIPLIDGLYVAGAQHGLSGMLLRGLACALSLLAPTILMGASLPAIVRWADASRGAAQWGFLYGANTLGAVFGCLLAGFYLLRVFDITVATGVAAAINLAVAIVSLLLASRAAASISPPASAPAIRTRDWSVHVVIACSGACALGAEVVWTRLMGLMLGATVYAFSLILAAFLIGLAFGAAAGSALVRKTSPRVALGWCQILVALGIAWTAYMIADAFPYWPIDPTLSTHPRFIFQIDWLRCLLAILPPTLAWGASFPLAFAAAGTQDGDAGRTVGGVYAANTLGAIFGALIVSLVLIPWIGAQNSQRVLLLLSAGGGFIILGPLLWRTRSASLTAMLALTVAVAGVLAWTLDAVPGELIAYGRRIATATGQATILYTGEGRDTSIAVSRRKSDNVVQFHVAGKVEASTASVDMKLQRMLGHLAALIDPNPRSVLVVGFGAGVTAGAFTTYPGIGRIVICEMEPLIPPASTRYFAQQNYGVMHDPRTQIVYDDARHFVLTTPEKFDVITSDPIHPFVKGSATLYSQEYFTMVKAHLNPGGVVTQWVPLYESDAASVKSEIATFFAVFPDGMIFANTENGGGYDVVLVGQKTPGKIDIDAIQAKLDLPVNQAAKLSLSDVGIASATSLLGTYIGDRRDLQPWLRDAQINHDDNLRLQYLAGLALNENHEDDIYRQIMSYRQLPGAPFTGTQTSLEALFKSMPQPDVSGPDT